MMDDFWGDFDCAVEIGQKLRDAERIELVPTRLIASSQRDVKRDNTLVDERSSEKTSEAKADSSQITRDQPKTLGNSPNLTLEIARSKDSGYDSEHVFPDAEVKLDNDIPGKKIIPLEEIALAAEQMKEKTQSSIDTAAVPRTERRLSSEHNPARFLENLFKKEQPPSLQGPPVKLYEDDWPFPHDRVYQQQPDGTWYFQIPNKYGGYDTTFHIPSGTTPEQYDFYHRDALVRHFVEREQSFEKLLDAEYKPSFFDGKASHIGNSSSDRIASQQNTRTPGQEHASPNNKDSVEQRALHTNDAIGAEAKVLKALLSDIPQEIRTTEDSTWHETEFSSRGDEGISPTETPRAEVTLKTQGKCYQNNHNAGLNDSLCDDRMFATRTDAEENTRPLTYLANQIPPDNVQSKLDPALDLKTVLKLEISSPNNNCEEIAVNNPCLGTNSEDGGVYNRDHDDDDITAGRSALQHDETDNYNWLLPRDNGVDTAVESLDATKDTCETPRHMYLHSQAETNADSQKSCDKLQHQDDTRVGLQEFQVNSLKSKSFHSKQSISDQECPASESEGSQNLSSRRKGSQELPQCEVGAALQESPPVYHTSIPNQQPSTENCYEKTDIRSQKETKDETGRSESPTRLFLGNDDIETWTDKVIGPANEKHDASVISPLISDYDSFSLSTIESADFELCSDGSTCDESHNTKRKPKNKFLALKAKLQSFVKCFTTCCL